MQVDVIGSGVGGDGRCQLRGDHAAAVCVRAPLTIGVEVDDDWSCHPARGEVDVAGVRVGDALPDSVQQNSVPLIVRIRMGSASNPAHRQNLEQQGHKVAAQAKPLMIGLARRSGGVGVVDGYRSGLACSIPDRTSGEDQCAGETGAGVDSSWRIYLAPEKSDRLVALAAWQSVD